MVEQFPNGLEPGTWAAKLHDASGSNDCTTIKSLMALVSSSLSKQSKQSQNFSVSAPDIDMYTPLHRAVENKHLEAVELLLKFNADPNASHPGLDGWTPLHLACWKDDLPVVKALISAAGSVISGGITSGDDGLLDWYGNRPSDLAKNPEIKSLLLKGNGSNTAANGNSPSTNANSVTSGSTDNAWDSQKLTEKSNHKASDVQARMIEFSLKHCKENEIGGEWEEK